MSRLAFICENGAYTVARGQEAARWFEKAMAEEIMKDILSAGMELLISAPDTCYVLSSGITITAVREGVQLPEEFQPEEVFQPYYTAQAMVNLSMRRRPDADAPQVGGVREDERVEVMEIDGDWARVRKNGTVGYVLSEHMRYYRRTDPFGPLIPGVTFLPYAAKAIEDVEIVDRDSGEVLRTILAESFEEIAMIACVIALRAALTFLLHWEVKQERHEEETGGNETDIAVIKPRTPRTKEKK